MAPTILHYLAIDTLLQCHYDPVWQLLELFNNTIFELLQANVMDCLLTLTAVFFVEMRGNNCIPLD